MLLKSIFRACRIFYIVIRFDLLGILNSFSKEKGILIRIIRILSTPVPKKYKHSPLPVRLRYALEALGPIFIKFGQILSTRNDLFPSDYIIELSKLQTKVHTFPNHIAKLIIVKSLGHTLQDIFCDFSTNPIASASIAQVYKATLLNGAVVAVKVLRPNIRKTIDLDLSVLLLMAQICENNFQIAKLIKPVQVVSEFKSIIYDELDFEKEAANAIKLRQLHIHDRAILIIPKIYSAYSTKEVIVLEWMDGIAINDLKTIDKLHINRKLLAERGVQIFYKQVFYNGFFHADMHPGNILCDKYGRYASVDFGIVGSLSKEDKLYLAINIVSFFNRDYRKVAITHVETGWAPYNTNIDDLEIELRNICDPLFKKKISEISFAQLLINLFKVSRRFEIPVQPQLLLLQKTLINVEGLGRLLYPQLDLWLTAKPILEKWILQQTGIRGIMSNIKSILPSLQYNIPLIPRKLIRYEQTLYQLEQQNKKHFFMLKKLNLFNKVLVIAIITIAVLLYIK